MVYSVWNSSAQSFDYFDGPGKTTDGVMPPRALRSPRKLGMTPDEASVRLPVGAKKVGSGEFAKGIIATRNGGSALGLDIPQLSPLQLILIGGVAALFFFGGRRR